jgi:hypothetical protein
MRPLLTRNDLAKDDKAAQRLVGGHKSAYINTIDRHIERGRVGPAYRVQAVVALALRAIRR